MSKRFAKFTKLDGGPAYVSRHAVLGVSQNANLTTEIDIGGTIDGSVAVYLVRETPEEVIEVLEGDV